MAIKTRKEQKASTNTNAINGKIREYIHDCINLDGYELGGDKPLILEVYEIFKSEKDWEIRRDGERRAFESWIRGLPCLCIEYVTCKQRQLLREWFSQTEEESEAYQDYKVEEIFYLKIVTQFFNLVNIAKENLRTKKGE